MIAAGLPIRDLVSILLPSAYRDGWILMLRAYLDDSGTDGRSPIVLVGGLIGNEAQWVSFDAAWRAKLKHPLDHKPALSEFGVYDCQNAIDEFEGYTRTESDFLTAKFRRIIQDSGVIGYGSGIDKVAWDELVTPEHRQNMGPAESFCVTRCVRNMLANAKDHFGEKKVAVIYDQGRRSILGNRYDYFDWSRGITDSPEVTSFAYAKVGDHPGLQGADMIATESFWLSKHQGDDARLRQNFQAYIKSALGFGDFMSRDVILKELASRNPDGTIKDASRV